MFDVRPVDNAGDLDWKKIQAVDGRAQFEKNRIIKEENQFKKIAQKEVEAKRKQEFILAQNLANQERIKKIAEQDRKKQEECEFRMMVEKEKHEKKLAKWLEIESITEEKAKKLQETIIKRTKEEKNRTAFDGKWLGLEKESEKNSFSWKNILFPKKLSFQFDMSRSMMGFAITALVILVGVGMVSYVSRGVGLKSSVLGASTDGFADLNSAVSDIAHQNFEDGAQKFDQAFANFSQGSDQLESMGGILLDVTRFIPFASKVSSGKNAVEAGKHFSAAGKSLNEIARVVAEVKNASNLAQQSSLSFLDIFKVAEKNIIEAKKELDSAQQNLDLIKIDDLPQDKQGKFLLVKQNLPDLRNALDLFLNNSHILADLLGGNGPRKYLFLFQNNSEMRATGGFIGSYGLLDIADGHVKKFFIDGIFNPDGQLREKIVPPFPIQKISTAWSMHDSNWFADFPMSARKAISFYEKTGGPSADGVITLTPTVMQKLLEITGPIEMPEYDVTLDAKNFIELTQFKVEVDYDKEENKPKKILSDLAPLVLDKLLSSKDLNVISKTMQAFFEGLNEKHILFYSENVELQKIISKQGWSGEVIASSKDYLSVINANINGFKTDAVIDEDIKHFAEIDEDGSIVDTVTITRKHSGGNSEYDWLNKVNADYMRVYVPLGSKLLEVSGQTREIDKEPLDYTALGFKRDSDVQNEEQSMVIDPESGTKIYQEAGKTVFANWTYVSPQETMTITYKYLLPFTLFKITVNENEQADSYSLVAQKQSGSIGSTFSSDIKYPKNYEIKWNFPSGNLGSDNEIKNVTKLNIDRFFGAVFKKN